MAIAESLIQIKRSQGANLPNFLRPGELAYSSDENGNGLGVLVVGSVETKADGSGHSLNMHVIGGKKYTTLLDAEAGKVTASKAIVADASGAVDTLTATTVKGAIEAVSGKEILTLGTANGMVVINEPYVVTDEGNVALADYVEALVESGVSLVAGDGIADIVKNAEGAFQIALKATGVTAGSYGSATAIPAITVNEYGQITAVEEKAVSTVLAVDEASVDLVNGKLATADGVKAVQTADGVVTLSADETVVRTSGEQTIDGQVTFVNAPKVGEDALVTEATVQSSLVYKTEIPTTVVVGGIEKDTTYPDGITVLNLIDTMLHPYVKPTPSGISLTASPAVLEKGNSATVNKATVTWTNGSQQISKVEVLHGSTVVGTKELTSLVTSAVVTFDNPVVVTKDTNPLKFTAKIYDATGSYTKESGSFSFVYPYFYGVVAEGEELTGDVISGLTKDVKAIGTKTYKYSTGGVSAQCVVAFPANYNDLKSVMDPNNFESIDSFTKQSVTLTANDGTSQTYDVYVCVTNVDDFAYKFIHA